MTFSLADRPSCRRPERLRRAPELGLALCAWYRVVPWGVGDRAPRKYQSPPRFVVHIERCWCQEHICPFIPRNHVNPPVVRASRGPTRARPSARQPTSSRAFSDWHASIADRGRHAPRAHPAGIRTPQPDHVCAERPRPTPPHSHARVHQLIGRT